MAIVLSGNLVGTAVVLGHDESTAFDTMRRFVVFSTLLGPCRLKPFRRRHRWEYLVHDYT